MWLSVSPVMYKMYNLSLCLLFLYSIPLFWKVPIFGLRYNIKYFLMSSPSSIKLPAPSTLWLLGYANEIKCHYNWVNVTGEFSSTQKSPQNAFFSACFLGSQSPLKFLCPKKGGHISRFWCRILITTYSKWQSSESLGWPAPPLPHISCGSLVYISTLPS